MYSSNFHLGFDRQAWLQQSFDVELLTRWAIEIDSYRHALHNFHIMTGGILGQYAEYRPGSATQIGDAALPLAAICVHVDLDGLAGAQAGQLGLLEIGSHPDIIERQNVHKLLSDIHVLTHLNPSLSDNSFHRRTNYRVAEVQVCLRKLDFPSRHLGVGYLHVGVVVGTRSCGQRLGQIYLRKFFRDFVILSVYGHYRFASMNQLTLIDVDGLDVPVDSRAQRHDIAVDLCIVSVFVLESIPVEIATCDDKYYHSQNYQDSFAVDS